MMMFLRAGALSALLGCAHPVAQAAAPAPSTSDKAVTPGATPPPARPAPAPTVAVPPAAKPAAAAPAVAPAPPPPARAPEAIIADMIAAVGGRAALERHTSLHTRMEITFKGLGITGISEHWAASGDRVLTTTTIPNVAASREGSDGKVFWSEDQINGLRLLEGAEAEQARVEAAWNAELRMQELFAKIEAKNEATNGPGEGSGYLECLVLTPKSGRPLTNCFDPRTHLMVLQKGVRSGPQGEMPYLARTSDWRPVGDVKVAFGTEIQVGPLAFTGKVLSAELDVPTAAAMFAVPSATNPGPGATPDKAKDKGKGKAREQDKGKSPTPKKGSEKASEKASEKPADAPH